MADMLFLHPPATAWFHSFRTASRKGSIRSAGLDGMGQPRLVSKYVPPEIDTISMLALI